MKPFIPKTTKGMPDAYGVTLIYINGESEKLELVEHSEDISADRFRFKSSGDTVGWVALHLIGRAEYDHRFIKIKELETQKKIEEANKLKIVN